VPLAVILIERLGIAAAFIAVAVVCLRWEGNAEREMNRFRGLFGRGPVSSRTVAFDLWAGRVVCGSLIALMVWFVIQWP
jgi:hypothetical protein